MPYRPIEELEKSLTRKPAAIEPKEINVEGEIGQPKLNYNAQKTIIDLPEATKFTDPSVPRVRPGQSGGTADQIIGGRSPDYSGYEDILNGIKDRKPRDTSTADLISMGLSAGLGAVTGQFGAAAKVAGNYGMDRFNKAEKREDDFEKQLQAIRLARAAQMAKGAKGTKVKGSGADGLTANQLLGKTYIDERGFERRHQFQTPEGGLVKDSSDPLVRMPTIQSVDLKKEDGSTEQGFKTANQIKKVGEQNASLKAGKTVNDETFLYNDKTQQEGVLSDLYNKTSNGLTGYGSRKYETVSTDVMNDPTLRKIKDAYSDVESGMLGMQQGGIAGAKIASKMFASALEKGNRTTDFDVVYSKDLNAGLKSKLDEWISKAQEGDKMPEDLRAELEQGFAIIESGLSSYHQRQTSDFTRKAKNSMGKEWRDDLGFPALKRFDRKAQDKMTDRALDNSRQWMSSQEWVQDLIVDGKPVVDPKTGKNIRAKHIMKNGEPYALQEVR